MKFTVRQIAQLIGGEVQGDDSLEINQFYKIEEGKEGGISFLANPRYEPYVYETRSSAIIVSDQFRPKRELSSSLIKVKDPYLAFTTLLSEYERIIKSIKKGIHVTAVVAENVKIPENNYVGAQACIESGVKVGEGSQIFPQVYLGENVKIGKNCVLYAGAKIYPDTEIGDNCIIHSGAVIGGDGFGFAPQPDGTYKNIPQLGNVKIGNSVSIGANCTIDRATMGSTVISDGVKLDNLVQVAHNVQIGANTVVASQTGIAGSTKIGKNCVIAGQVGIVGHLEIADGTKIGAQSGINSSIKEKNKEYTGSPHNELKQQLKTWVHLRKLPELATRVTELEKKMNGNEY
jgi:UDP-3-O-[3-hydroxymyristoyl] glucosamine N-acyltransferase